MAINKIFYNFASLFEHKTTIVGKFTEYNIALQNLPQGLSTFEYHLDKDFFVNMEKDEIHGADLHVTLEIERKNDLFALHFDVEGTVTLLCDRCQDALEWPIDETYDINVKFGDDYNDSSDTLLEIPASDPELNVAYMICDTVVLAIPMRHVHPTGKCNRAMSALLKKHSAHIDDEDAELQDSLINEMDSMEAQADNDGHSGRNTDPRWDALRGLAGDNE